MFEWIMAGGSIIAIWIALLMIAVLFVMRLYVIINDKTDLKSSLFILLLPFSLGYFSRYQENSRFKKIYELLIIVQFAFLLLGMIMIIYTRYL